MIHVGISQISTNIPMNQLSSIPSSFIDNSPPTIAILRPPSSLDTLQNSNYASLPVAVSTTHLRKSTNGPYAIDAKPPSFVTTTIREETKENSRSQDSAGVLVQNVLTLQIHNSFSILLHFYEHQRHLSSDMQENLLPFKLTKYFFPLFV